MANKIYDFLPAHLRNRDLEDIFDSTLERAFSKGSLEKVRAYVGRREKGIDEDDRYLSFPEHLFNRDNYGLEPVFVNSGIRDRIFYEDLLNSMYNKGMLTNDHRRLFSGERKTINLPIDADKFINWQLYYWVRPLALYKHVVIDGLAQYENDGSPKLELLKLNGEQVYINHDGIPITSNNKPEYITIDDGADNYWSKINSWQHHEDIRHLISNAPGATKIENISSRTTTQPLVDTGELDFYYVKSDNSELFIQAKRPIIEFDKQLEIYQDVTEWSVPEFRLYDADGNRLEDGFTIFEYVQDDLFTPDPLLNIDVKVQSGDFNSEFVYQIAMPEGSSYKLGETLTPLYIESEFNYRNLRREFGNEGITVLDLPQDPISENDIDVYVDGIKQNGNYTVSSNTIFFDNEVDGNVYVDYCTKNPVDIDGDRIWQRIDPILEFNIDNEDYNYVELTYSVFYEHLLRQVETTNGLVGEANSLNNYRKLLNGSKTKFNKFGSVIVKHETDIKKGYFAITRDDYDPIKSVEFLANAYSSYKNKFILKVRELLKEDNLDSKSNLEIFETAIAELASLKRENINIFTGSTMINFGELFNHYSEGLLNVTLGGFEHGIPPELNPLSISEAPENVVIILNDRIVRYQNEYVISDSGRNVIFKDYLIQPTDTVIVRFYEKNAETYIPPSATSLNISPLHVPEIFTDNQYENPVEFIKGHDGSVTPSWGDRTDSILMMFENLVYSRNSDKSTEKKERNLGFIGEQDSDYTFAEKRYATYPFFKKWMIKNNIGDTRNTTFDINDWKTWNYRALSDDLPGSWRSIISFVYGTEFIFTQPWLTLGVTERPKTALFGWVTDSRYELEGGYFTEVDYTAYSFWTSLKSVANATWPIPVDSNGNMREILELFSLVSSDNNILRQDWEFGDGSPEELAWRRSSEYPFIEFILKVTLKPFYILDIYDTQIQNIINYFNKREGYNTQAIVSERDAYEFKLGSKLGGFVNNFKLFSERNSLSNSSKSEIPKDNYELFVHSGEPNRSEGFSAIVIEKVSLDEQYPYYSLLDINSYELDDIVLRENDGKYYKRKVSGVTQNEIDRVSEPVYFDYSAWVLVSQPNVKKFGYRISGYDDFNPVFYTLDWDKSSGVKRWSSDGDLANIRQWTAGEFYRNDFYAEYNNKAYISLNEHQASESFDNDLSEGKWKLLREWPVVNTVDALGYKEVFQDQLKVHNYGDIFETLDEIAQLFVGYQEYLKAVGWDFTDIDEFSEIVDFETLLVKFLNWSREKHAVGEYITLTPILKSGRFSTPYGVASISSNTNKNFYRVVDSDGRQISKEYIKFNIDGDGIVWNSSVPVYGIKIDIQDIEHAIVIDREDSYGDINYDPISHNRNLRMLIDCNRTADWDGTLTANGYIATGDLLLPNLETMVEETRYYRDTLVDQSLEIVNRLKEAQISFSPRMYLTNHFVDRESQVEFYKGFLAGKGTKQSTNRIINKKSNLNDVSHDEVWAFKIDEYGKTNNRNIISKTYNRADINSDPFEIKWDENNKFTLNPNGYYRTAPIMTSGYVDPKDVNYVVRNTSILESTVRETFYEGDLAWIRFDDEREWDVKRLSEVAEINYIGETSDGQLYIGLSNEVEISDPVFLKINSVEVDPNINGYFNLVDDGTNVYNGVTVYEYLVFDSEYEPFIVEIDETTDNSVYVPTPDDSGVEAIGSVSNPVFIDGERIVINDNVYVYNSSANAPTFGLTIGGETATPDPFITTGEEARIVVYDENNNILNSSTDVRFQGTKLQGENAVTSNKGDIISINGVNVTIDYSSQTSISATSSADTDSIFDSDLSLTLTDENSTASVTSADISIAGTITNPTITSTKTLYINDIPATFTVPGPITANDTTETFALEPTPVTSITLSNDMTKFQTGLITIDNGIDPIQTLTTSDYSYSNNTITFNTAILDGQVDDDGDPATPTVDEDGFVNISVELIGIPVAQSLDKNDIVSIINAAGAPVTASIVSDRINIDTGSSFIEFSGTALVDIGLSTTDFLVRSKLIDINEQLQSVSFVSSSIDSNNKLNITTSSEQLTIGGALATVLGFNPKEYSATTDPTATSIASQIVSASIPSVTSSNVGNTISIIFDGPELTVSEVTSGALSRLGITNTNGTKTIKAIDTIITDLNLILPSNTRAEKYAGTDRLVITSSAKRVELSNYSGNPWDDLGIATGDYVNTNSETATVQLFKDQINAQATDVVVGVSSDGRMIFTSTGTSLSFDGTEQSMLEKVGIYGTYSSVKSNANFKVMRWKSVRYTPNFIYQDFDTWFTDLGINSVTKIWVDDCSDKAWGNDTGWAVLNYSTTSSNPEFIARQVDNTVDMEDIKRMIVRDGDTFKTYQLFDPLNMKMPGSITKDIDYVDWQDPAKYDDEYSNDLWLDEHIGDIWWDTKTARYYRYKDYGDGNKNINVDYVKRYWGKLVPGSTITIKQWKSSSTVPEDITWFNTETRWDTDTNRSITTYYYWSTIGIDVPEKEFTIDEIKMLIESGGVTNKFIPIDDRTILTSNTSLLDSDEIEYSVYKQNSKDLETKHVDWHMVSKNNSVPIEQVYLNDLRDSIVGKKLEEIKVFIANDDQVIFKDDSISGLTLTNAVVSINSEFLEALNVNFGADEVVLSDVTVSSGDIVRVYKLSEYDGWFKDVSTARLNFASIVNDYMKRKRLSSEFPLYHEFITTGQGVLQLENWALTEEFDTIKRYEYLSKTRNFDMIKMFASGTESFKVDLPDGAEYYFEHNGNLRLVHKEDGTLKVQYFDAIESDTEISKYYQNMYAAQTYELIHMLYTYADVKFIKSMFFGMIDYMYTEKTYPDWIFKTSYIDLFMMNKSLRQYVIYQNDNYDDIIDYVNETKPYHTKIRETERVYPYAESMDADVDIYEAMELELKLGGYSRYKDRVYDGGDTSIVFERYLDIYTLEESIPEGLRELYNLYTFNKHLIQTVRMGEGHELTTKQQEVINKWNSLQQQYLMDPANEYEAGGLLKRFNTLTAEKDGYDTGEFDAHIKESMTLKMTDESGVNFHIYDIFGRMYHFKVESTLTIDSFDGESVTTTGVTRYAKDNTTPLIALENADGEVEFMTYNYKSDDTLTIDNRSVFNGISSSFIQGDTVYILGSDKK